MHQGLFWAVGDNVKRWKVGDEVIIHCNRDDGDDEECNGGECNVFKISKNMGIQELTMVHLLNLQLFNLDNFKKTTALILGGKWLLYVNIGNIL